MNLPIIGGKGKLYDASNRELVTEINYQMREKPSGEGAPGEWWGGFILEEVIEQGDYLIELEDGRKGTCTVSLMMNWMQCALPDVYNYAFKGISLLTQQKEQIP